jgi:hypothetical protein
MGDFVRALTLYKIMLDFGLLSLALFCSWGSGELNSQHHKKYAIIFNGGDSKDKASDLIAAGTLQNATIVGRAFSQRTEEGRAAYEKLGYEVIVLEPVAHNSSLLPTIDNFKAALARVKDAEIVNIDLIAHGGAYAPDDIISNEPLSANESRSVLERFPLSEQPKPITATVGPYRMFEAQPTFRFLIASTVGQNSKEQLLNSIGTQDLRSALRNLQERNPGVETNVHTSSCYGGTVGFEISDLPKTTVFSATESRYINASYKDGPKATHDYLEYFYQSIKEGASQMEAHRNAIDHTQNAILDNTAILKGRSLPLFYQGRTLSQQFTLQWCRDHRPNLEAALPPSDLQTLGQCPITKPRPFVRTLSTAIALRQARELSRNSANLFQYHAQETCNYKGPEEALDELNRKTFESAMAWVEKAIEEASPASIYQDRLRLEAMKPFSTAKEAAPPSRPNDKETFGYKDSARKSLAKFKSACPLGRDHNDIFKCGPLWSDTLRSLKELGIHPGLKAEETCTSNPNRESAAIANTAEVSQEMPKLKQIRHDYSNWAYCLRDLKEHPEAVFSQTVNGTPTYPIFDPVSTPMKDVCLASQQQAGIYEYDLACYDEFEQRADDASKKKLLEIYVQENKPL